ncbi:MAG: 3-isopropylmalate dehydratase large subunit [Deltaproteobacteria bacterium]|nr:3-isopropylmalate dehydratase large subunit [Deltaproteobacteria bacterium]
MSGQTLTEKILARASGKKEVSPGEIVIAGVDALFMHSPSYKFRHFEKIGGVKSVWDGDKVIVAAGHHMFLPSNQDYADAVTFVRKGCKQYGIKHLYDMGTGIGHYLMVEKGHVWPGAIAVGSDSHTTAYGCIGCLASPMNFETTEVMLSGKAWFKVPPTIMVKLEGITKRGVSARDVAQHVLGIIGPDGALWHAVEYAGSYINRLSIQQRMIFSLLTTEMGGMCGMMESDDLVLRFMERRSRQAFEPVYRDSDAQYARILEIDVSALEPQVAIPPQPSDTKLLAEVEGVQVQQAYVGGCTGGGIDDMRMAAEIMRGRKVDGEVRMIVVPGTREIFDQMQSEGLVDIFANAGALITPPYCGPCQMVCVGHLGGGEVMIGTHPRNLPGRAGKDTAIYLASPYSTAAAAVAGEITDPRKYL